jgi:3-methyl-2-oxobutanoate hydroxymethyltransferase
MTLSATTPDSFTFEKHMAEYLQDRKAVSIPGLMSMREQGNKITMLTCYDASFASLMDRCGVEVLLIGDSLGMVCWRTSIHAASDDCRHCLPHRFVARGNQKALIVADMPSAVMPHRKQRTQCRAADTGWCTDGENRRRNWLLPVIQFLTERAIPVCAHLG